MASAEGKSSSLSLVRTLLRKSLRIITSDGRLFLGTFAGTDKQLNILLVNADEYRFAPIESANPNGRYVALVMIPRRFILKIEAQNGEELMEAGSAGSSESDSDMYL